MKHLTQVYLSRLCIVYKLPLIVLTLLLMAFFLVNTSAYASSKNSVSILSLENLERERAALIKDIVNPKLNGEKRAHNIAKRQRSLTDMERMVMRDTRLLQSNNKLVKRAFADYDTTFLVHAGAEKNRSASEQWLVGVNLTNHAVMNTTTGFRK